MGIKKYKSYIELKSKIPTNGKCLAILYLYLIYNF